MSKSLVDFIEEFFNAIENKDIDTVIAYFSDDAELIDPHYPNSHMKGKKAILKGLTWSFKFLKRFSFTITNYFESKDGFSAVVEVATVHELPNGKKLNTPQAIIFEVDNSRIIRLRAYQPYGPDGIGGILLKIIRLKRKLFG